MLVPLSIIFIVKNAKNAKNANKNTKNAKKDDQKYNPKEALTDFFDSDFNKIKSQLNVDKEALS